MTTTSETTVRIERTYRSTPARSWQLLASPEGAAAWLGEPPTPWWHGSVEGPGAGELLETATGERFEVSSVEPGERIRLRALGPVLPESTIELSLSPDRGRTVIVLRHEGIMLEALAEQLHEHWCRALDRIDDLLVDA